jgi:hypothetical protein
MIDLIYTSKGNLPITELTRKVNWQFSPNQITLVETYTDDMGDVVKQGSDVFILPSNMSIQITEGQLG